MVRDAPMESGHELEALSSAHFARPCVRNLDSGPFASSVGPWLIHTAGRSGTY